MSDNIYTIDDPLKLVQRTWEISDVFQKLKFDEYSRADEDYRGHQDLTNRDPYLAYPSSPLPYSIIESQTARDIASLFSKTPFVPLGSLLDEHSDNARNLQDTLQCLFDLGNFKQEMTVAGKMRRLYGLSYIESLPFYDEVSVMEPFVVEAGGVPIRADEEKQTVRRFRLKFNSYAPWEIFRDPYAKTLADARWVIKVTLASRRDLEQRAKRGDFGDNFDMSKLSDGQGPTKVPSDDWGQRMRQNLKLTSPQGDSDIGFWLRWESKDRYIDVWDFKSVLRDLQGDKLPYNHKRVNLSALVNNYDPNPAMRFDGISELKPVESTIAMHNMTLAQLLNSHSMHNHKVLLYQKGKVAADQLVMRPGGRIEVTGLLGGQRLQDAVAEIPLAPLPSDAYAIPQMLEGMIRVAVGVFEQDEGQQGKTQTATGDAIRRQQSDSRKGMTISMFEWELEDIAKICFSHMEQFMEEPDWASIIGQERAKQMRFTNPNLIPGGCRYHFTGADRASEQLVKRRELIDLISIVGPKMALLKKLFDQYNWTESEFEELVAEFQQEQQQATQAQEQAQETELQNVFAKRRVSGQAQLANKVEEVAVGLRSLPGQNGSNATQRTTK